MKPVSPEFHAGIYYATFYTTAGAAATYLPIWLGAQGITPSQIGVINAAPVFVMLVLNMFVGRLADRAGDWRTVIVAGALIAAAAPFGLFAVSGFWSASIVWTLTMVPVMATQPVCDAATVRLTRRRGTDFGAIRAWGTLGYMLTNTVTGALAALFGGAAFVPFFVGLAVLRGAAALQLPRFRRPPENDARGAAPPAVMVASRTREFFRPWFLLPVVGNALILATHLILNAFAALVWADAGISAPVIGILVAISAASEAMMMFAFQRFAKRHSARVLLLVSALAGVVRWTAMAFNPPVAILAVLQMMHSLTFALGYLGGVNFIANWTSEDVAAEAQSFMVVIRQALTVVALTVFGFLVALMGAKAFLVAALLSLVGAGCAGLSLRLMPAASEQNGISSAS